MSENFIRVLAFIVLAALVAVSSCSAWRNSGDNAAAPIERSQ